MPKSPDKSETVRIKSSFAEFIREESKRLNLNFLETLYYIINVYRYEISQRSVLRTVDVVQAQHQTTVPEKEEVKPKGGDNLPTVTNSSTTDDDDDFYANCK
jgi:superfamily II RNA helicase